MTIVKQAKKLLKRTVKDFKLYHIITELKHLPTRKLFYNTAKNQAWHKYSFRLFTRLIHAQWFLYFTNNLVEYNLVSFFYTYSHYFHWVNCLLYKWPRNFKGDFSVTKSSSELSVHFHEIQCKDKRENYLFKVHLTNLSVNN